MSQTFRARRNISRPFGRLELIICKDCGSRIKTYTRIRKRCEPCAENRAKKQRESYRRAHYCNSFCGPRLTHCQNCGEIMQYRKMDIVDCLTCAKALEPSRRRARGKRSYIKLRALGAHHTQRPGRADELNAQFREESKQLSDGYIRKQLAKRSLCAASDFPPDLVAAKRQVLKIQRYLKKAQK